VDIAFSIDNVAERFELERYGAKWQRANEIVDMTHALRQTQSNITTQLCFTVNIQNIYYLDQLLAWADTKNFTSVYFNMMHDPYEMNIQHMTPAAQLLVINKLKSVIWPTKYKQEINNLITFINNGAGSDGTEFMKKMRRMDEYRDQSFLDTHPEIAQAMGY
jgi:FlaA1/EpsC-like NDP-sugar epimerase